MIRVVFLGTSGSVPTRERGLPSLYIEFRGNRLLFDCGEGTQRQMRIAGLPFMKIDKIFITHFHADHCLGLGGLIQTLDLFKRQKKLEIYGPQGTEEVIKKVITTGHFILEGFDLEINEIDTRGITQIVAERDYSVWAAPLNHSVPCLGYRFEERKRRKFLKKRALEFGVPEGPLFGRLQDEEDNKIGSKVIRADDVLGPPRAGRRVTYISDTRPCKRGVELASHSDVLIHEATLSEEERASAIQGKHSTAKEAATVAKKAGVKELYLTHISQRYDDTSELEREARRVFKRTKVAKDFDTIEL